MKRLLALCVLGVFSLPSIVYGEIITDPATIIKTVNSGKSGAWLDTVALKKCLLADTERENIAEQLKLVITERDTLNLSVTAYQISLQASNKQVNLSYDQIGRYEAYIKMLENDLHVWYRDPLIMGSLGLVAGVLLSTGAYLTLHK